MFFFSFFFFKQKTAYEMRISDWSSDVCSSDLLTCKSGLFRGGGLGIADPPDHTTHVITDQQCPGIVYQHIHRTAPSSIFLGQKAGKQINGEALGMTLLIKFDEYDLVADRKSVVWGKSGSVRLYLGGRSIIK